MIDIHAHILPALDDGPPTLEDAVAMVRAAAADGVTDIVATPHADSEYAFDPAAVESRVRELAEACDHAVRIHRGCDFHLSAPNILDALENPSRFSIDGGRFLLVEFSNLAIIPNVESIFAQFGSVGITPIVTHPERNPLLRQQLSRLESWIEAGACLQVTAQSFLGDFGKSAQRFSTDLMDRRLVHFIASDAHDLTHRPPALSPCYRWIAGKYGPGTAETLFISNPAAVLSDSPAA
jgi:protein-tyrosine phosphatase